jgi:hypothetical protein
MRPECTEDDDWFDRVEKLLAVLDGDDADDPIRQIARHEADKRINAILGPILFIGALWWAHREYGQQGSYLVLGLGVAWFFWTIVRQDWDPAHERHLIGMQAEDLNRLQLLAEAHEAGEQTWRVKEKEYERDKREIQVFGGDRWDGSWRRIHSFIMELQKLSPRKRRKRMMGAARRARPALEQGQQLADRKGAELIHWARGYLQKLNQG